MTYIFLLFISLCFACSSDSSCGCGGRCELQDAICYIRGPECRGYTPICIPSSGNCVKCANNFDCSSDNPFCINYNCVRCRDINDCASDNSCDTICSGSSCQIRSNLNCASSRQRCLIGQARCVDCLSNDDCPSLSPYCDTMGTYTCHQCLANAHCQTDSDCSASCDLSNRKCKQGDPIVNCSLNSTNLYCHKASYSCVRCTSDVHCSNELVSKRCNTDGDNSCHQCVKDQHCRSRGTCDSKCINSDICNDNPSPLVCNKSECNTEAGICFPSVGVRLLISYVLFYLLIIFI